MRVHAFLEQWGLINLQAKTPKRERRLDVPLKMGLSDALKNNVQVAVRTSLVQKPAAPKPSSHGCSNCKAEPSFTRRDDEYKLCELCYKEGRFPSQSTALDFQRIEPIKRPWTEQETLTLLSLVEELGNKWDVIAQRVGRTREQCVQHFLGLPTVEQIDATQINTSMIGHAILPFSATDNPVLGALAFLAAAVHPKVAAAAAQAALSEANRLQALTEESMSKVSATAIGCAAARATEFAEAENRKGQRISDAIVDLQLQKIKTKMNIYDELERTLEEDFKELEQQRLQLFLDRYNLRKQMLALEQKHNVQ